MKKFNLNSYIYFDLTEKGKLRIGEPHFNACVQLQDNGHYRAQAHAFCNLFGQGLQNGFDLEVNTNVFIEDKDLKEAIA